MAGLRPGVKCQEEATSGSRSRLGPEGWVGYGPEQGGEESGWQVWSKPDPLAGERLQEPNEEERGS